MNSSGGKFTSLAAPTTARSACQQPPKTPHAPHAPLPPPPLEVGSKTEVSASNGLKWGALDYEEVKWSSLKLAVEVNVAEPKTTAPLGKGYMPISNLLRSLVWPSTLDCLLNVPRPNKRTACKKIALKLFCFWPDLEKVKEFLNLLIQYSNTNFNFRRPLLHNFWEKGRQSF